MSNGRLLTSTEASRLLGISSRTVLRMAERGDLPYAQRLPGPTGGYLFEADVIHAKAIERADLEPRRAS